MQAQTAAAMPPTLPPMLPDYAELQCASNFTFLHGASGADELATRAARLGYQALAITDECSVAGVVRAHVEAKKAGLHLVIGSQFRLTCGGSRSGLPGSSFSLVILAQNRDGYGNLCELITLARTRADKGQYLLRPDDLDSPGEGLGHLCGMPDCLVLLAPRYGIGFDELLAQAQWVKAVFPGRAWIALTLLLQSRDDWHRDTVEQVAREAGLPIVATGDVCMHVRSRKPIQDVLTAIRLGRPVAECGYELAPSAERHLRSRMRLANIYPPEALAESVKIAEQCTFSLDELRYEYPDEIVPPGETPASYLRRETLRGAENRFPDGVPPAVRTQIEHELALIEELEYEPYFLTVYDIVCFARNKKILCQGRGSAANSVVCYCLGITEVDPSRSTLLFERFISKERGEPPDIDVDFEHQRREEVIQYIYEKYGRRRAALTAVVISYRPRSVLRDVGKALGIDLAVVDQVAKAHRWWDSKTELAQRFVECGLDPGSTVARHWADIAVRLLSFPRHLSQHPGGFVIARDKLSRLVPIENAAMEDRSVVQWDKDDLDALGILKVDILALGMLSMLRRAFDMVSAWRGKPFGMPEVPKEDPTTYDMICKADTIGVFQIESRAQMSMLPRLKPREFYDLVVQVAIVRPGPIQGGMVHPYLQRRLKREDVVYPKEDLRPALARTLGVPIFQEQVMQIAVIAAGFSAGQANELRRSMAAWKRKGNMAAYEEQLRSGMAERGYEPKFIQDIINQIHGFGEYGFPESHAASFALLAYASAWLKCHEPAIFLAALLNSQPMGFYSPSQLVQDARRHGVEVRPVDVLESDWDAKLEAGSADQPAVRLGFNMVNGLSLEGGRRIEAARMMRQFDDLSDLALRAQLSRHDLEMLAHANALHSLAGNRREALWQAVAGAADKGVLKQAPIREEAICLEAPTEGQEIVADYASVGLTLGRHPVSLLRPLLTRKRFLSAEVLNRFPGGRSVSACGIVTCRQRPGTANGTMFVTIEDETGFVNVIVWPALIEQFRRELLASRLLGVYGTWQCESDVRHLVARRLMDMSSLLGQLATRSRDFA